MKFRKIHVSDAIQWTGDNLLEIVKFMGENVSENSQRQWHDYTDIVNRDGLKILTLEGELKATIGDWIMKGVEGEFYPIKPNILAKTYEKVD